MGLPVTVKVNFRGNVKRFLASDLDKLEWSSVEAWIKASFGINHYQVKYFDEESEEICINSQDEYDEAIKSAEKQGNHLNMNVYKMKGQACGGPLKTEVKELKGDLRPAPPYPSRVKTVDKGTQVTPEREAVAAKDCKGTKAEDEPPPMWFRSYMEKFKDEVVKEVVERMCSDFSGQCCTHKSPAAPPEPSGPSCAPIGPRPGPPAATMGPKPGPSTSGGSLGYTPNCSSCNKLTSEGAYKCSVCPSCILCEMCRHSHDPSHNLVRTKTPLSIPEHGMSGESSRFPRRGDRTVRKAERQRLKAERRQLRAEVKEMKKKLRLEKRGLQWSGPSTSGRVALTNTASTQAPSDTASGPAPDPQASSPEGPGALLPTMAALFLDENLPDGTRLEPGTKFIKYWKMRNSGTIGWTAETKLVFMWGNLGLASDGKLAVPVPLLLPGQVGVVSVTFVAPVLEGTYTSHWRLAHGGQQFGPRVWCSIVVDGLNAPQHQRTPPQLRSAAKDEGDVGGEGPFLPYVDLLTAQDLLSFELMDINIVQELEKVPTNTPVDLTPCMSPLPHDLPQKDHTDAPKCFGGKQKHPWEAAIQEEERDEEISGAQFLFETVIRSLTLEEAPDHKPVRTTHHSCNRLPKIFPWGCDPGSGQACEQSQREGKENDGPMAESLAPPPFLFLSQLEEMTAAPASWHHHDDDDDDDDENDDDCKDCKVEEWDEVSSMTSSSSSCDDFIIVLPDCFDTSRPLGESMYSSAMSQPDTVVTATLASPETLQEEDYASDVGGEEEKEEEEQSVVDQDQDLVGGSQPLTIHSSVNQMLCASQTLEAATLTPEVVPAPPALYSPRSEALYLAEDACHEADRSHTPMVHVNVPFGLSRSAGSASSAFETYNPRPSNALQPRGQGGITEGLVKGALSVAASAYKALFTGPNCPIQRGVDPAGRQDPSLMAMLLEMGFMDRRVNQRLLRKHGYNLLHTVNELVQLAEDTAPQRALEAPH
ncbi:NBR1 autophagy cargo receptor a isoform X1 [Nerophis lumbriciformis]|uniref:NBR1 autophagy cargo receptor a isoform X1 n=1 Tax=Nerophis lumbriciformis TaxID=546530 RepID=UPI002ADF9DEE|nr:next to BRCA1 gene 1 protein-like isoform X1 [Nerophis lumbriciformis]